jgi:predicted AAA+ superfamily ATPase
MDQLSLGPGGIRGKTSRKRKFRGDSLRVSRSNYSWWGRLVENAVGAHLLNHLSGFPYSVYYWRHKGSVLETKDT